MLKDQSNYIIVPFENRINSRFEAIRCSIKEALSNYERKPKSNLNLYSTDYSESYVFSKG
jgi:hypothetical protein